MNRTRTVISAAVCTGLLLLLAGCSSDDNWRAQADRLDEAFTATASTSAAQDLDPLNSGDADEREFVSGSATYEVGAAEVADLLRSAVEEELPAAETRCLQVDRSAAMVALGLPGDNEPDWPSLQCTVTDDGEAFGDVLIAGTLEQRSVVGYSFGPGTVPFAVNN